MDDKYSLSTKVFHTLREDILSGKYRPNEELKEKNIGDEFGVSRTPVREALRQLELEGLVSIIPNKGAYVVGISKSDIQDIYEIRARLEGLCAKWACEQSSIYLSPFFLHISTTLLNVLLSKNLRWLAPAGQGPLREVIGKLLLFC